MSTQFLPHPLNKQNPVGKGTAFFWKTLSCYQLRRFILQTERLPCFVQGCLKEIPETSSQPRCLHRRPCHVIAPACFTQQRESSSWKHQCKCVNVSRAHQLSTLSQPGNCVSRACGCESISECLMEIHWQILKSAKVLHSAAPGFPLYCCFN